MSSVASVKARLKNLSRETGKTMQEILVAYGLERTIYRLSKSPYVGNFTLKGGIFLYAVFSGDYARATTDIDFLAQQISNSMENIKTVFSDIFALEADDPLRFDLETLKVTSITEFKKYHGVNVSVKAYLDKTRIDISIDIGFGDVIYPERVEMDFPVVLGDEPPRVYTYSLVSSIAEKFEAIVSLGYENSRFKDYYDIYMIAKRFDFDGRDMLEAVRETFANRHTALDEIVAFEPGFADDSLRQARWKAFIKRKKVMQPVSLEEAIGVIRELLLPVTGAITAESAFDKKWDCQKMEWV